jgi:hypothetical protein
MKIKSLTTLKNLTVGLPLVINQGVQPGSPGNSALIEEAEGNYVVTWNKKDPLGYVESRHFIVYPSNIVSVEFEPTPVSVTSKK